MVFVLSFCGGESGRASPSLRPKMSISVAVAKHFRIKSCNIKTVWSVLFYFLPIQTLNNKNCNKGCKTQFTVSLAITHVKLKDLEGNGLNPRNDYVKERDHGEGLNVYHVTSDVINVGRQHWIQVHDRIIAANTINSSIQESRFHDIN